MTRVEVYKKTTDDWYGNFKIVGDRRVSDLVRVSYLGNITAYKEGLDPIYRTCVWGNDDCGYDFDTGNEAEAKAVFEVLIALEFVNHKDAKNLGMVPA